MIIIKKHFIAGSILLSLIVLFTHIAFTVPEQTKAIAYYVDAIDGDDANPGTYDRTTRTIKAWKTLDRVFTYSSEQKFSAGDSILLRRGQEHYGGNAEGGTAARWLTNFESSGSDELPIVIDTYGDVVRDAEGKDINKPVVRLRVSKVQPGEWLPTTTPGVWMLARQTFNTNRLWEDDLPLRKCSDETCIDGNWYHYNESCSGCIHWNTLYYKPTSGQPDDHVTHFSRWGTATFHNQSHIIIRNLEFRTSDRPIRFRTDTAAVSDVTVEQCVFYASEFGPEVEVRNFPVQRIRILNNYFKYNVRAVSFVAMLNGIGIHDSEVAYNIADNCNCMGIWGGDQEQFYLQNVNNTHIHHNRINGGRTTGIAMWSGNGGTSQNNIVEYNYIQNLHGQDGFVARGWYLGSGATFDTCSGNIIRYNMVTNSDVGMVPINCWVSADSPNQIYNNTMVGNGTNFLYRVGARNWQVKNNINASPTATASVPVPVHVDHESTDNQFISDRNIYYPTQGQSFRYAGELYDYSGWLSISQQDVNSMTLDPQFVNAAAEDYCPVITSPLVDAAENLGQIQDIFDVKIFKQPDIGACEYHPGKSIRSPSLKGTQVNLNESSCI